MAFFEMNASSGIEEFAYNPLLREICKGDITITKSSHHSYFEAMKIYGVRKWTTLMKDYYRKDLRQLGIRMRALKDLLYDFEKIQELPEKERNLICKTHGRELASVVNILESSVKLLARWISPYSLLTLWRMNKKKDTLPPKGIVMLGGKKQLPFIQTLIFSIRVVHNSSLPIELFYLGDDDLDKASREILSTSYPDIFTRNIYDFVSSYYLDFTGFDSKPFVVLFANAVEVLYIDVDAVLLQIPEVFFNFSQYQETGALFFHDRMWGRDGGPKKLLNLVTDHTYPSTTDRLYSIQFNGDHEQESGVLVVDKSRNFLGLFGACKLMDTAEKEIMQIYSYGDKESFWLGFEMMQLPYSWGDFYPGSIGDATKNENDQGSVVRES